MMLCRWMLLTLLNSHHKFVLLGLIITSWLSALHSIKNHHVSPVVWSSAAPPRRSAPGSGSSAPRTSYWCLSWWESSRTQPGITWWGWTLLKQTILDNIDLWRTSWYFLREAPSCSWSDALLTSDGGAVHDLILGDSVVFVVDTRPGARRLSLDDVDLHVLDLDPH